MLLLIVVLISYLSILCKHMFYFQAGVEQSVPFHHHSTFSSYYDARVKTSRTDSAAIPESMSPAGYPENTCPACTLGTSRTNPSPSCPGCPGPCPNLDTKPPLLSPGPSAVQGPTPLNQNPDSRSKKSQNPRQESNKSSKRPYTSMCSR